MTGSAVTGEEAKRTELYLALGEFIYRFSRLEFLLRHLIGEHLACTEDDFDAITAPYDFAALCRVCTALLPDACELFNDCLGLNADRVRIVHSLWSVDEHGVSARHVSKQKLEAKFHYTELGAIKKVTRRASELTTRLARVIMISFPPPNDEEQSSEPLDPPRFPSPETGQA